MLSKALNRKKFMCLSGNTTRSQLMEREIAINENTAGATYFCIVTLAAF